jgi:hypothetical protein
VGASVTDVFTYTVKDPGGLTDTAQLTITVNGANDAPVGVDNTGAAVEAGGVLNGTAGSNAAGNVLTNDTVGVQPLISVALYPSSTTLPGLVFNSGVFTYSPPALPSLQP